MLATPFTDGGAHVDHASLRRYCTEVTGRGCAAVVVLGVIGEPAALTPEERCAVVATAVDAGVTVQVAVMARTAQERLTEVAVMADRFGERIAGYLVPVTTARADELRAEIEAVHARGRRPVAVQDYPASSGVHIAVDDLATAVAGLACVSAIKCEAAPTFGRIRRLHRLVPDVPLMSGLGGAGLVDDLSQGARLVAAGTSRPEIAVQVVRAWQAGDEVAARALVASSAAAVAFEIQQGTSIAIRKEHWRRQGILDSAAVRPPTHPYEAWLAPLSAGHGFPAARRAAPTPT